MGTLRDLDNMPHRAFGGENRIRRCRRNWARWARDAKNRYRAKEENAEGRADTLKQWPIQFLLS
jgi:hypothetical protein